MTAAPEVGALVTVLTEPVDSRILDFRRGDRATVVAVDPPRHGRFRFTCEVERSGQRYRFAQEELLVTPDAGLSTVGALLLGLVAIPLLLLAFVMGGQKVICDHGGQQAYCEQVR